MIDKILEDRAKTHGNFSVQAHIAQTLKEVTVPFKHKLTASQRESVDMILHKIARICAGDPNEIDHWQDIAGYATLVAKQLGEGGKNERD